MYNPDSSVPTLSTTPFGKLFSVTISSHLAALRLLLFLLTAIEQTFQIDGKTFTLSATQPRSWPQFQFFPQPLFPLFLGFVLSLPARVDGVWWFTLWPVCQRKLPIMDLIILAGVLCTKESACPPLIRKRNFFLGE